MQHLYQRILIQIPDRGVFQAIQKSKNIFQLYVLTYLFQKVCHKVVKKSGKVYQNNKYNITESVYALGLKSAYIQVRMPNVKSAYLQVRK